jgi:hypothetical protein
MKQPRLATRILLLTTLSLGMWAVNPTVSSAQVQPLQSGMPAPEIEGGTEWLGVKSPLTLKDLRGKFVIIDIWTLC